MKKLNNKGFSLVELIIVIAIMAILIGVVGTQVIPYLENSRKAKDAQVFSSWNTAGMSAYTSCAGGLTGGTNYFISVSKNGSGKCVIEAGTFQYSGTTPAKDATATQDPGNLVRVFQELTGITTSTDFESYMVSKKGKEVTDVTIYIPDEGAIFTVITGGEFDTIENK